MNHADEFRRCLEDCDTAAIRRLWAHVSPHLPQPETEQAALIAIHHARTQAESIRLSLRGYSHAWLLDRGLPSGLPDRMRPLAERMYPRVVGVVGISVNAKYPVVRQAIQGVMEAAVYEAYADGHEGQPEVVKARMMEAREREKRGLGLL